MSPQKKKVKRVFICLGEKQNETVGLFPTFLFQGITRDTKWYKLIINTTTQIRHKTTNATKDQIESKTNRKNETKREKE